MPSSKAPPFSRALVFNVTGLVLALGLALLVAILWQGTAAADAAARQEIDETLNRSVERLQILARAAEMTQESAERIVRTNGVSESNLRATLESSLAAFEQRPELSYLGIALAATGDYGCLERAQNGAIRLRLFPGPHAERPMARRFLLTRTGWLLEQEGPSGGYDVRAQPSYQAALAQPDKGLWIPSYPWILHSGDNASVWGFSYAKALRDDDGRIACVLDTDFDVPALNAFLHSLATEYRCELQVIELGKVPRLIGAEGLGPVPLQPAAWLAPLIEANGAATADRIEVEGQRRWVAAHQLTLMGGVSWLVVASRKDPLLAAPIRHQLYQLITAGLVLFLGLVLVSMRIGRRFSQPLAALEQRVAGFGQPGAGAAIAAAPPASDGFRETQLLDDTFSRMAAAVREREEELSEQNDRLRSALAQMAALEARTARQRDALIRHTEDRGPEDDVALLLQRLTESSASTLESARASVWRYSPDQGRLECRTLFDLRAGSHTSGQQLSASDCPNYFRALADGEVMAVDDACEDPRTREFLDGYLRPLGIGAMLDVPVYVAGKVVGVLCHEHVGGPREWTDDEKSFSVAMANMVSLGFESEERRLLQEQFLRAQRMEAVGTLAGGLAHDLNNILAPMLMGAALLKMKLTSEKDRKIVAMIESSAQRGSGIIRQLLTFGRGTGGERTNVQLRHLIRDLVHIVQETFPRNIELKSSIGDNLWPVANADGTQLHQVLLNLSVNSRDAMPAGGRLEIHAENVRLDTGSPLLCGSAPAGAYVRLTVTDTGEGIPPAVIERIFDPFFTTKPVGKGTGLGLSSVLGIVKNHGGFLGVASTPGAGTTFHIHLPAVESVQASAEAGTDDEIARGDGQLILLADDEAAMRQATRDILELHGYRVVTAENGEAAVKRFIENRGAVQLVVSDMDMPVMGGAQLVRSLQILDKDLRFLILSGSMDADKQAELAQLGIEQILPKPCEAAQLLQALSKILACRDRSESTSASAPTRRSSAAGV